MTFSGTPEVNGSPAQGEGWSSMGMGLPGGGGICKPGRAKGIIHLGES